MTDRDPESGQFTSAEPLFGREAELADAGYSLPPTPEATSNDLTPEEAAESVASSPDEVVKVDYLDGEGNVLPLYDEEGIPVEGAEALSIDQASALLSEMHTTASDSSAKSVSDDFAAQVDRLRADAIKADPKLAEQAGIEPPAEDGVKIDSGKEPIPDLSAINDEAKLEEALRAHPKVKEAIDAEINATAAVRSQLQNDISQSTALMLSMIADQLPELANTPQQQWPAIVAEWQRTNDPRLHKAIALDQKAGNLLNVARQEMQRQSESANKAFEAYAKAEDARFAEVWKNDSPETQREVQQGLLKFFKSEGVPEDVFLHAYKTDPVLRSAAGQKFMYQAVKAMQELERIRSAPAKATAKQLPPVNRPGAAPLRVNGGANLASLNARFNQSGSVKDAAALLAASRRAK